MRLLWRVLSDGEDTSSLLPFEEMLLAHPFLLEDRPHFVDFDLYGIGDPDLYFGMLLFFERGVEKAMTPLPSERPGPHRTPAPSIACT